MLGRNRRASAQRKAAGSRAVNPKKDYRICRMQPEDMICCIGFAFVCSAAIAWLFYRSIYGMLVCPAICLLSVQKRKKEKIRKQQQCLREHFKECLRVVTASLYAGYSMENAFAEAEKELVRLLGKQQDMCRELHWMNQQIRLNLPVETLLADLADRSGVEEIYSFGQVFAYAKRSGSDFHRILKDTTDRIAQKTELERELVTMVAAKKLEQRIMNVVPLGILLFADISSPGFLQILYTGVFGRTVMTIFLLIYGAAYILAEKMTDIRI